MRPSSEQTTQSRNPSEAPEPMQINKTLVKSRLRLETRNRPKLTQPTLNLKPELGPALSRTRTRSRQTEPPKKYKTGNVPNGAEELEPSVGLWAVEHYSIQGFHEGGAKEKFDHHNGKKGK